MAQGIAGQLVASALQQSQNEGPDLAGSAARGAQIALEVEKLKQQKMQLAQQKEQAEVAKFEKVGSWLDTYAKMPEGPAKKAFGTNFIPQGIQALGLQEKIHPLNQEMLIKDSKVAAAFIAGVRDGKYSISGLMDSEYIAKNYPELTRDASAAEIASLAGEYTQTLNKADEERGQRQATRENAIIAANAAYGRQKDDQMSAGEVEVRKKVGTEFANYSAIGGKAGMDKAEQALQKAIDDLSAKDGAKPKVITGGVIENAPYGGTDAVLKRTNKPLKALRDSVLSTQNIKALSGDPNPTQQQIDAIQARLLDPSADNATNIKKLQADLDQLRATRSSKESTFKQYGFMPAERPASGKTKAPPKMSFKDLSPADQTAAVRAISQRTGKTETQVRKELEGK